MYRKSSLFGAILIALFGLTVTGFGQDSLNVRRLGQIAHPGWGYYAWDVALQGGRAYIASWGHGVSIADVSRRDTLIDVGHFFPPC